MSRKHWSALKDLCSHVITGSLAFVVIASVAVGLDYSVHWLESMGVAPAIVIGLKAAHYVIFFLDLLLLLIFLWRAGGRFIRDT